MILRPLRGGERQGDPEADLRVHEDEVPWHHAHDDERRAVQAQLASDCGGIAAIKPLAQRAAENHLVLLADLALFRGEDPPACRTNPDESEEGRRDGHARNLLRRAVDLQRRVPLLEHRLLFQGGHRPETIVVIGGAAAILIGDAGLWIEVGHQHDRVGVWTRQWAQ
jgi:hypothetical protein